VHTLLPWIGFVALVLAFLAIDLGVFNRIPHQISTREAFNTSLMWISLALLFNLFIWHSQGAEPALTFFTGYLLEKLLSLDNMFVFIMIFKFFEIAPRHQHRVLFWGILGAIIFRLLLIFFGIQLIKSVDWILYLFGVFLIYSSYKIYSERRKPIKIETNVILLHLKRWIPIQENYKGRHFFLHSNGKWIATPLFLALVVMEVSDIVFALDSLPAIFAVTLDPFIVFTSNIFAILGLRSLYFLLANVVTRFYYFQHAIAIILGFAGVKLLLAHHIDIPLWISLGIIAGTLGLAILLSLGQDKRDKKQH
jgi:tellurite resistance protein TerC